MSTYLGNADEIRVESDERGWELHVDSDAGSFIFNIHGVSEQLLKETRKIADYWEEGRSAAASYIPPADEVGYAPSDPKHPDWHSVHSDIWDNREKT